MDDQLGISSVLAAALVNDDSVELEALLQMPDDALNIDNELIDPWFDLNTSMKSNEDSTKDNFAKAGLQLDK